MLEALSALLLINLLGMLSPGPDMVMVLRNASSGKRQAALCVMGVLLGFSIHISLAIGGLSILIKQSPLLFEVLRWSGAGFLVFLGLKTLFSRSELIELAGEPQPKRAKKVVLSGVACNLLNPKILVFVVSVFSQFIGSDTLLSEKLILGAALLLETALLWYVIVRILSHHRVQVKLQRYQQWVNRFSGSTLLGMGTLLGLHS
ncbi:lysine transporter LysE [Agarivorans sp. Toyoura001]|uniref:LysE family translocator n=1 Tax=Agarivorans sp. Toyoura001 TaxID=2283141 RepID=UPI0010D53126|nr:LysE family translocator [Agarivorans sp. Toyoura001]GDY26712.1 lysine transporter LysE [Agarivorans sp. Toyoura001]